MPNEIKKVNHSKCSRTELNSAPQSIWKLVLPVCMYNINKETNINNEPNNV